MNVREFRDFMMENRNFTIIVLHVVASFAACRVMQYFGYLSPINNNNILNWDAAWYVSIKENGYLFVADKMCNMAFFPLFPYIWKILDVSPIFMAVLNNVIFSVSFYFLIKGEKLPSVCVLLILAIPSFIFFTLPYSESIYFLCVTLILKGYEKKSVGLKVIGFLSASVARSVSIVFIPAIILVEIASGDSSNRLSKRILNVFINIVSCLMGVIITTLLQQYQTGKWFYFLEVQQFWFRQWTIPRFPLTTINEPDIIGIDTVGLTVGLIAVFFVIIWAYRFLVRKKIYLTTNPVNDAVLFSTLYLSATVILDTCFTFNNGQSTNIWSMNRHILCTPFAVLFIIWLFKISNDSLVEIIGICTIIIVCVYFTKISTYPIHLLYYFAFFSSFIILKVFPTTKSVIWLFYGIALIVQTFVMENFLTGQWVG